MSYEGFSWNSWSVGMFVGLVSIFVGFFCVWPGVVLFSSSSVLWGNVFVVDYVSYVLSLLSIFIMLGLFYWFDFLSFLSKVLLGVSLFSSILCYSCVHMLWFWVFYEMSMLPLLVLLSTDSPYSERYTALWYFCGYIVFGSLPMLLCICYLSSVCGDFGMYAFSGVDSELDALVLFLLGLIFITKVPLIPFHPWLPIVHAEASSPVSACLSGYVMKLGLLGIFRFCLEVVPLLFLSWGYVASCFIASIAFFLMALTELDSKRWLAFLSLGHMGVAVAWLAFGGWKWSYLCFLYSLGHGLSAALMFFLIWFVSLLSGTRNFFLSKHVFSSSLFFRFVLCFSMGTVACVPPTVQFFSEACLMSELFSLGGGLLVVLYYAYLFFSGLIPVIFVSFVLTRRYDVSYSGLVLSMPLLCMVFLLFWSYCLFIVC